MGQAAPEVWSALLEHRERALRVARARSGGSDEAEDIVQEAMARIAGMQSVDLDRLPGLLSAVTGNLAADAHRLRARDARARGRIAGAEARGQAGPEEDVCDVHEARWLWQVAGTLGEQDRRALQLRAHGLDVSQIAAELGVTYKAAENALGRARTKMRAAWSATAALIGVLLGRRPRREPAAVVAAPLAAAAFVLAVLAPAAQPDVQPEPPPATAAANGGSTATAPAAMSATAEGPALPPPAAPTQPALDGPSKPPPPPTGPAPERTIVERPVDAGPVQVGRVYVEEHRQDEPMLDSVRRCVAEGVSLDPSHLGCAP